MTATPRSMLLAALAALALAPMAASGATIAVTTTADPVGPSCPSASNCSIRGAVAVAGDGDVISLPAGTYAVTQGRVNIDAAVTIQGAGAGSTIIDASASSPHDGVFRVRSSVRIFPNATFRDVAITGGSVSAGGPVGGAITNNSEYAILVLDRVHLFGNSVIASGTDSLGGGAVRSLGSVQVVDSTIESNTATISDSEGRGGGGAIFITGPGVSNGAGHGRLAIVNSTIRNNTATVSGKANSFSLGDGGGAIHSDGTGGVTISGSTITGNTTTTTNSGGESGGGALYVENAGADVTDSVFSANSVNATATTDPNPPPPGASNHGGGAIYLDGTASTFDAVTLSGNSVVVNGLATDANTSSTNGGGAVYQYGTNLSIANSTVSGNSVTLPAADRSGGGGLLDNGNSTQITNSTFQGNVASVGQPPNPSADQANGGGGILFVIVRYGVTLASVTVAGNSAPSATGGGLLVYHNYGGVTAVRIGGSIVSGNTSGIGATANCARSSVTQVPSQTQIISLGYNIADDAANSCGFTAAGDRIANPQLGPLAGNGGPTATMAIPAGSPAVDGGNPQGCTGANGGPLLVDQRGVARPAAGSGLCDIGAYELAAPAPAPAPPAPPTTPGVRVTISPSASGPWRISTRASLGGAGTISQVGTIRSLRGRSVRVCAPGRRVTAARTVTLTCAIRASQRRAVALAGRRVRLTITFVPAGGKPVTFRNTVVLPVPGRTAVTG